jgi:hypothetical protein
MSENSTIVSAFNNHFAEFVDDILTIFPDNRDILNAKTSLGLLRKANPKIIVTFWKNYIVANYRQQIEDGDCQFFLNKDYSIDINSTSSSKNSNELIDAINRFRGPLLQLSEENLNKCVKYLQNLTKLSLLY